MKKKLPSFILAVLMVCGFAACSGETQSNADNHSDWVWVRNGVTYGTLSDTGYYFCDEDVLHYYDFTAKATTVLCAKAGCDHDSQECDGYIRTVGAIPMFFYSDRLYYCPFGAAEVYSRNATGAELKKIGDLAVKYVKERKGVEIECCAVAEDFLYYQASVLDDVQENGTIVTKTVMQCIGRLDLITGRDEVLFEEALEKNNEMLILCAVGQKGVLFSYREVTETDRNDPDYLTALNTIPVTLKCWDAETGKVTDLLRKTNEELININMVSGGKVYFATKFGQNTKPPKYDYNFTHSYDLVTGKEEAACSYYTRYQLGGGYVYCRYVDGTYFVYNMNDGQQLPCELEEPVDLVVVNTSDKGFIARMFYTENTDENGLSTGKMRYYYIAHASLADGLQEKDLQYIYTQ